MIVRKTNKTETLFTFDFGDAPFGIWILVELWSKTSYSILYDTANTGLAMKWPIQNKTKCDIKWVYERERKRDRERIYSNEMGNGIVENRGV